MPKMVGNHPLIREIFKTDDNAVAAMGSKLGFYTPFNSQGHIGTGPQHYQMGDSNPNRGNSL